MTARRKTSAYKRRAVGRRMASRREAPKRVILFPTEPTKIARKKLQAAVDAVLARRAQ